jgi:hypothetical protein
MKWLATVTMSGDRFSVGILDLLLNLIFTTATQLTQSSAEWAHCDSSYPKRRLTTILFR